MAMRNANVGQTIEKDERSDRVFDGASHPDLEGYGLTDTVLSKRRGGFKGLLGKVSTVLIKHGVEERGIEPLPEDVRSS